MPEVHVTDEQGTEHIFPDGSTPDMISRAMNLRPGIPRPSVNMQEMPLSRAQRSLLPDEGLVGLASQGREGYASDPGVSGAMSVAGAGTAAALASPYALPFIAAGARAALPLVKSGAKAGITYAATDAAIRGAKHLPVVGDYVRKMPGIDNLPFLVSLLAGGNKGSRKPGGEPDATRENVPYAGEEEPTMKPGGEPDATRGNEPYAGEDYAAPEAGAQAKPPGFGFKQGRLVLSPEEAQSEDQIQAIAKDRASKRGMRYAGGIKPKGTMAQVSQ